MNNYDIKMKIFEEFCIKIGGIYQSCKINIIWKLDIQALKSYTFVK